MTRVIPRALTIAGSDSGGGAGIQADIKTFTALNVYGMSAIAALTAQNTQRVLGINDTPPEFLELQIDAVIDDIGVDAVKTGMLSNEHLVRAVAKKIKQYGVEKVVVDPVMRSKGGDSLLAKKAEVALKDELLPLAYIVTPNLSEAEILSGIRVSSIEEMKQAAKEIKALGPKTVLVKGGHLESAEEAIDVLFDGHEFHMYRAPRIDTKNTHGTGCTYSAAICAGLAKGFQVLDAVEDAKEYVTQAIRHSFNLGKGQGPLNHYWKSE